MTRTAEDRYSLVARGANDGLWDWDLRTHQLDLSPRWKAILGYGEHELSSSPDEWFGRVYPEDLAPLHAAIGQHLEGRTDYLEHQHRLRHRSGSYRVVFCRGVAARDERGRPHRMAGSLTDVTDRAAAPPAAAEHEPARDGLTGLPNRRVFLSVLKRALRRRTRHSDYLFAVLHVDLDHLALVNHTMGHAVGDQVLVAAAARLTSCVRPGDTVARLDGDEFIVLLERVRDTADTIRVAERIQQAFRASFRVDGRDVFISASVGIAVEATETRPQDLLHDAQEATLRAKARGPGRYEMFDPTMHARALALLQLESDLRRALEGQELRLLYQPVVSLETRRLLGFEALVRWAHPTRGLMNPEEFIPIAEKTGLVVPLGWWVFREAARQVRAWREEFPELDRLWVSVNVSPRQFQEPDLAERIVALVHEHGVPPSAMKLEITEGVLMDDPGAAFALIERLHQAGLRLDIDDFGTGFSSLSYLHRLPVDGLKIDRSFVSELTLSGGTSEIVKTIIALAATLKLQVIAEGVETEAQASRLRALGCERAQGHLFEKPMDADAARLLLAGSRRPSLSLAR